MTHALIYMHMDEQFWLHCAPTQCSEECISVGKVLVGVCVCLNQWGDGITWHILAHDLHGTLGPYSLIHGVLMDERGIG